MVTSVTITYCGKLFSDYPTHYMLQNIERQQNLRNMLMLTLTKTNVTSTSYRQRLALEKWKITSTTTSGSRRRCTSHSIGPPVQIYDIHGVGPDESVCYLYKITSIILLSAQVRLLIFKSMHRAQLINSSSITHVPGMSNQLNTYSDNRFGGS